MEVVTYNLNPQFNEDSFYEVLSKFTSDFLKIHSNKVFTDIEYYINYRKFYNKPVLTFDEYYLEYLTLGVMLNKYSGHAMSSSGFVNNILIILYKNRNRLAFAKPLIDRLRGWLSFKFLTKTNNLTVIEDANQLKKLLQWMDASGEYSEESIRLKNWYNYIKRLSPESQQTLIKGCKHTAFNFEIKARLKLSLYTCNVEYYKERNLAEHRHKENYLFCNRHEVEYHLNMFGAEILNRTLKDDFSKTESKVILLPTCMNQPVTGECKAVYYNQQLRCMACSAGCNINKKRKLYASQNIEVVLIPHSSGFSKYLSYWKNQNTTGLIGVACVLNLLKGGYEMQKLNIPSQCVFLDYCGCKKHWHKDGIPTDLNEEQLQKVVDVLKKPAPVMETVS
jgi:hypothetical protein